MVGTGGAVTVGLDGRTEAREQNSSHPSVGIVGLRHHWGHRLKLDKWGSQKNHKIGTVNERPVSEQFPLICRHRGLVRAGKWKLGNWLQQLIWVGLVGRETKRSHPCGGIEASFLGGGVKLNCLIPQNLHSLALRANIGPSYWLRKEKVPCWSFFLHSKPLCWHSATVFMSPIYCYLCFVLNIKEPQL